MLKLENITKTFPQTPEAVLKNINLEIKDGEYCIILGSNGSGKSTLFKVISGEYQPGSGRIILDKNDITKISTSQRAEFISSVAQDITQGTVQDMTLLENMCLSHSRGKKAGFVSYKQKANEIETEVKSLNLGLEKFLNSKMSELSGGQRQSIATLMAMFPKPQILLLDEHTSALDPRARKKVMEFTDNYIKNQNITSLMITHNIDDAINYGNRLVIMHHGEIVFDESGKKKSVLTKEKILNILHKVGGPL